VIFAHASAEGGVAAVARSSHHGREELEMKVKDIMRAGKVAVVRPEDSLALATQIMLWSRVRHLPVVRDGQVVGLLSERDIFRRGSAVGAKEAARDPVERVMTSPALTIDPDKPLVSAMWLMAGRKLGCLPVVGPEGLVGIITTTDVVRHQFENGLRMQAPSAAPV
jgi:CBS domain-containing protein